MIFSKIPLGNVIERFLDFLTKHISFLTRALSNGLENGIKGIESFFLFFHPLLLIFIFAILSWIIGAQETNVLQSRPTNLSTLKKMQHKASLMKKIPAIKMGIFTFLGFFLIWNLNLWDAMITTFSLVMIATFFSVLIGLPLGILAALFQRFYKIIIPFLDFMQTMPAFVYLIPAIPFFGLGRVSAIFATIIFSMPPVIRLTCLGIKNLPADLIEAANAFGSNKMQKLFKVQLPLAKSTIMAGVNQTIMLSLSMVVIAAMIGAGGLGGEVWRAIQRLEPGKGFESGLAVVILAIVLDRVTQKMAQKK